MKSSIIAILLLLLTSTASGNTPLYLYYSDSLALKHDHMRDDTTSHISYNGDITFTVYFYAGGFTQKDAMFAHIKPKNTTSSNRTYAFTAAFFDDDKKLVTAFTQTTELTPGSEMQLGGMYSEIADGEWKRVRTYQFLVKELSAPSNARVSCVIEKYDLLQSLQKDGYMDTLDLAMHENAMDIEMIRRVINARVYSVESKRYVAHLLSEKHPEHLQLRDTISGVLPINHHTYHEDGTKTRKLDDLLKDDVQYLTLRGAIFSPSRAATIGKNPSAETAARYTKAEKWVNRVVQSLPAHKEVLRLWKTKIHDAC